MTDRSTSGRVEELVAGFKAEVESYRVIVSQLMQNFLLAAKPRL